tara:strand:+ start:108 stop:956 length:849 start_codon:yes stop_codon:yes gene_type:complete
MSDIVFVADFFAEQIPGGGELNNEELISILENNEYNVKKINSHHCNENLLRSFSDDTNFIIANFINLPEECKNVLARDKKYIIYEHDHKYLKTRNPAEYKNFIAPKDHIINYNFYKNALAILCQSDFHSNIVKSNLELENIKSLGGNLWSDSTLSLIKELSKIEKMPTCAIMNSNNWHKNTNGAVRLCKAKQWEYVLIEPCEYSDFLNRLGKNEKFIFLPKTPETLSRIVVEARMMGMSVITNGLVGATKEPWFDMKGEALIQFMIHKKKEIYNLVKETLSI